MVKMLVYACLTDAYLKSSNSRHLCSYIFTDLQEQTIYLLSSSLNVSNKQIVLLASRSNTSYNVRCS